MPDNIWLSLLWVAVCVLVILGLAYWVTRMVASRPGQGGTLFSRAEVEVRILARTAIGKDQNLLVVEAGQKYFLLGAAPGGITCLSQFTQEEAEGWAIKHVEECKKRQTMSFKSALDAVIKQKRQR